MTTRARPQAAAERRRSPRLRREILRDALPGSVELLQDNRAGEVPDGYLADYLALAWLRWAGGRLRLTTSGAALCRQLVERQHSAAAA